LRQLGVAFGDPFPLPLGKLVISQEQVGPRRVFALQGGDEIDELMGFVAVAGVVKRAMNEFLENEMPMRTGSEFCAGEQTPEVVNVSVQISGDKDLLGVVYVDGAASSTGSCVESLDGAMKRSQEAVSVGHITTWQGSDGRTECLEVQAKSSSALVRRY
jgi:hypothetical protein